MNEQHKNAERMQEAIQTLIELGATMQNVGPYQNYELRAKYGAPALVHEGETRTIVILPDVFSNKLCSFSMKS